MAQRPGLAETAEDVTRRTRAAWGHRPPDTLLRGARVLMPSGELLARDVAIVGRRIAAVGEGLVAAGEASVDLAGRVIVPGYLEPHCHALGPLSVGSFCGQALVHGTGAVLADDSFAYALLSTEQYPAMLDVSASLPLVLRWSLRLEGPRTLPLASVTRLIEREDVIQVGELMTRPVLDELPDEVAGVLAAARASGLRVEGHSPGASPRTLGIAAAAGVTADHEARNAPELRERLRSGLWAFIRHTDLLRDVPGIVEEALEQKISLERTALTTDWALPPWIARHGLIDAAIKAAIGAGLAPQEAYACATRRPATYLGLDAHLGSVAPARLASLNVLPDLHEPRPERVFSLGREVAREGELLTEVPDVDWAGLGAPAWSRRRQSPVVETFCAREHDPSVFLESAAVLRQGAGADGGQPLVCVTIDPDAHTYTRAWLHGLAPGLEGIASTLTPRRLLVAAGGDPAALARCVDEVMRHGGGIALHFDGGVHSLPLPVGGVVTAAPFEDVLGFWELAASTFASLGSRIADPLSALFYIASDSLPGARFNARGLVETRSGELLAPSRPIV